ncbi:olfactory receptor 6F1-like [Gopherus flavomarginatus]|uniref:olfactory receptor 6F1-like n=1 Tax=Gopherus flavomarginatus TaxID=286002 RepID=UPI0021CBBE26|nr:olfactory receptor 6F1-like [Gopherus flavomarginatus]
MMNPENGNQTSITEFILRGFGTLPELQILLFLLFLVIYIATMAGNIFIVALVVTDQHLHIPMYFFLGNLSCLETCYTSTILPSLLASLLTEGRTISFSGCITQYYFFASMVATECFLLLVMSYDRCLAIGNPLHYAAHMTVRSCLQLAGGSWTGGFLLSSLTTLLISQLTFCGPKDIDHFFCDFIPLLKLSCNDPQMMEMLALTLSLIFLLVLFLLTSMSYIYIIAIILKIPSSTGRQKAFSTCSSHLIVVTMYYGTLLIAYMFPTINTLRDFKKVLSIFYTVLTPLVNPLIYSLRNKEVKEALRKASRKSMFGQC